MATFLSNLWESVFTPGTTPTLLLATNAAFASLQLLLLGLLAATYSIHFLILSILSGGLWWAINWFATEMAAAEAAEQEAKRIRAAKGKEAAARKTGAGEVDWGAEGGDEKEEGDETETETEVVRGRAAEKGSATLLKPQAKAATGASVGESQSSTTKRKSLIDSGELSTDSEWEKVDN
jgi:hypothetical protein